MRRSPDLGNSDGGFFIRKAGRQERKREEKRELAARAFGRRFKRSFDLDFFLFSFPVFLPSLLKLVFVCLSFVQVLVSHEAVSKVMDDRSHCVPLCRFRVVAGECRLHAVASHAHVAHAQ
jgi:hypothetical protein